MNTLNNNNLNTNNSIDEKEIPLYMFWTQSLKDRIVKLAQKEDRSMTKQILHMLQTEADRLERLEIEKK